MQKGYFSEPGCSASLWHGSGTLSCSHTGTCFHPLVYLWRKKKHKIWSHVRFFSHLPPCLNVGESERSGWISASVLAPFISGPESTGVAVPFRASKVQGPSGLRWGYRAQREAALIWYVDVLRLCRVLSSDGYITVRSSIRTMLLTTKRLIKCGPKHVWKWYTSLELNRITFITNVVIFRVWAVIFKEWMLLKSKTQKAKVQVLICHFIRLWLGQGLCHTGHHNLVMHVRLKHSGAWKGAKKLLATGHGHVY